MKEGSACVGGVVGVLFCVLICILSISSKLRYSGWLEYRTNVYLGVAWLICGWSICALVLICSAFLRCVTAAPPVPVFHRPGLYGILLIGSGGRKHWLRKNLKH